MPRLMRSLSVVLIAPGLDDPTRLVERPEFIAEPTIEALDEGVLHRLPRRDVVKTNLAIASPAEHREAGQRGPVVERVCFWVAP